MTTTPNQTVTERFEDWMQRRQDDPDRAGEFTIAPGESDELDAYIASEYPLPLEEAEVLKDVEGIDTDHLESDSRE